MKSAGIYLHIPFCAVKCMYCDFYSITDRESSIPTFIKAIVQEIKECRIDTSDWIIDTIFIGGGTPSLLSENMIESLLSQLHKNHVELIIVIGGGNFFRGSDLEKLGIQRVTADHMGMLATVINSLALQSSIEQLDIECRVTSSSTVDAVC